ncbi:hypothetical protein KR026_003526, partial [Drosophila bipectinata]
FDERVMVHGRHYKFKNGDWVQSNLRIDMKGCDFLKSFVNRYYKSVVEHFPNPICPLPVGEYPVINALISTENWPNMINPGMSEEVLIFEIDGKSIGGVKGHLNLIEKNT